MGAGAPAPRPAPPALSSRGPAYRQLNVRIPVELDDRYRQTLRNLQDAGERVTLTQLLCAVLRSGPTDADAARDLLASWTARGRREPGGELR